MARYEDYAGNEVPIEQARVMRDAGVHVLSEASQQALRAAGARIEQLRERHIKRGS